MHGPLTTTYEFKQKVRLHANNIYAVLKEIESVKIANGSWNFITVKFMISVGGVLSGYIFHRTFRSKLN